MTLRRFLDAAYAMWIEEFQKAGANLFEAVDRFANLRAARREEEPAPDVAAMNDQSLQNLKTILAGTGRV